MKTKIALIKDRFNPNKVWQIKQTSNGRYHVTQSIENVVLYPYVETPLSFISQILALSLDEIRQSLKPTS